MVEQDPLVSPVQQALMVKREYQDVPASRVRLDCLVERVWLVHLE